MKIGRNMIVVVLATFCLTAVLFITIPTRSANINYDPWMDINDDGKINILDIGAVAKAFGSTGDPAKNVTIVNPIPGVCLPSWYIYSAPFIVCTESIDQHPSPHGIGIGIYETTILVHNPSGPYTPYSSLTITKKIVVALEETQTYLEPIVLPPVELNSDQTFSINSKEIFSASGQISHDFVHKGYVSIISLSPYLDVNAFYTVSECKLQPFSVGNTTSICSQTIPPKPYSPVTP